MRRFMAIGITVGLFLLVQGCGLALPESARVTAAAETSTSMSPQTSSETPQGTAASVSVIGPAALTLTEETATLTKPEPIVTETETAVPNTPTSAAKSQLNQPSASNGPGAAGSLVVMQTGFGQIDEQVGYAFAVANWNQLKAVRQVGYQVAVYDQAGTELAQDSGAIAVIKREQFVFVGGTLSVPAGSSAARLEVQLASSKEGGEQGAPTFAPVDLATAGLDKSTLDKAVGRVNNGYDVTVNNVQVAAVVYDTNDAIIGGGTLLIDAIPAKGQIEVEVPIIFDRKADVGRIQLFPTPTDPSPVSQRPVGDKSGLGALAVPFAESEPNNSQAAANFIPLGFDAGEDVQVIVSGSAAPPLVPGPLTPNPEDEGDINKATNTGLTAGGSGAVTTAGDIGDGPFGGTSGDVDFFRVDANAGQLISAATTAGALGPLDTIIAVYDSAGNLVGFDDDGGPGFDSLLIFSAPAADSYYVVVSGFLTLLDDPFDSSSGNGAGSTGPYEVVIGLDAVDRDFFSADLEPGDILGINSTMAGGFLSILSPSGELLIGSPQEASSLYPAASSLPGGGVTSASYVIDTAGTHAISILPAGNYELEVEVYRPVLEAEVIGTQQILFLDFDGETFDGAIFGGPSIMRTLSPLSSFLAGWGLTGADESAVIDAIVAAVTENFDDVRLGNNGDRDASGVHGEYDIEILNSRDHPDPFGQPHVSRVIVGGTIAELGIGTIGLAQSIDPGNFETEETAVVLLDLLSAGAANPNSLNQYTLGGGATIFDVIGAGVGNITAHEAGHFFGSWHTNNVNAAANIMDQGGILDNTVGVGPDDIFGTGDDVDVDFGKDIYVPNEGFTGTEDTLNLIAFGLSTGKAGPNLVVNPTALSSTQIPGQVKNLNLTLSNPGTETVNWTIAELNTGTNCDAPSDISWASVLPVAGSTISGLMTSTVVTFDATLITNRTLTGTLCIDSNDLLEPRITVPLTMTVGLSELYLPTLFKNR